MAQQQEQQHIVVLVGLQGARLQDTLGSRSSCEQAARRALFEGRHVIVDRCNFDSSQRSTWVRLAAEACRRWAACHSRLLPRTAAIAGALGRPADDALLCPCQLRTTSHGTAFPCCRPPKRVAVFLDTPVEVCKARAAGRKHPTLSPSKAPGVIDRCAAAARCRLLVSGT
jgi:hypothetical protein